MEINITWNVCRVCLQEENNTASSISVANLQMRNIFDADAEDHFNTAKHIFDCTNVTIKPNDSLPQKICRKCLQFLKLAVNFRTTCQNSNSYLQNILEKAKSTTSLFKMDKPRELEFDDIIESQCDELYDAGKSEKGNDKNENCSQLAVELHDEEDQKQEEFTTIGFDKNFSQSTTNFLGISKESEKKSVNPTQVDLCELFLSTHSDTEPMDNTDRNDHHEDNDDNNSVDYVQFSGDKKSLGHELEKSIQTAPAAGETEDVEIYKANKNAHYLSIKNLEEPLNEEEVEEHAEMLETNSHEPVDIVRNDANDELFYIFGEDIIPKAVVDDEITDENNGDSTNAPATTEVMDDHNEVGISSDIDEDYEDDREGGENNEDDDEDSNNGADNITVIDETDINAAFDPMDYIDEEYVKCENLSRESTPIMQHENSLYYEDDEKLFVMDGTKIEKIRKQAESKLIEHYNTEKLRIKKFNKGNIKLTGEQQTLRIDHQQLSIADCTCPICGNLLSSRNLLKHHMKIHRNERNHECEICSKRFTTACNLTTHIRVHTGEKPYKCKYCDRRFSDKSTLVKHERSHTDERPYTCQVCQKSFSLSSSLKAHERVHTGEKPYNCETCGKSFKLLHQLKAHRSTNAHRLRLDGELIVPIGTFQFIPLQETKSKVKNINK